LDSRRRDAGDVVFRQKTDQMACDFPGLFERSEGARQFRDQPRHLLDRLAAAQRRQPARFLPRIETEPNQGRNHAE
jgi:hypothetical protein